MQYEEISIRDHATLRRLLGILDGMVNTMEDGGRIEIADAVALLDLLRFFEPQYRQMLGGTEREPSISGLEDALKTKRARAFVQDSRRLTSMLRDHLDLEAAETEESPSKSFGKASPLSRLEKKYENVTVGSDFKVERDSTHVPGPASYR